MKVIFLDIDGVLNSMGSARKSPFRQCFLSSAVKALNSIILATGAQIVVSSTWRMYPYHWAQLFREEGIVAAPMSFTPVLNDETRGREIAAWLDARTRIDRIVILDDDDDMGNLRRYLVQTDPRIGLTDANAKRAIEILS